MSVKFTTFGSMSMLIERSDGFKILVDPYITGNPQCKIKKEDLYDVDLILVSHVAFDHFGDAPDIIANGHAEMRCDRSSLKIMKEKGLVKGSNVKSVGYGAVLEYGPTTIRVMRAYHSSTIKYDDGSFCYAPPLGFMIMVEPGVTYYAPGDTTVYGDMKLMNELYHPNVMSCGISNVKPGAGREKDLREAAFETLWLGADIVFPGHYIEGGTDLEEWKLYMKAINPRARIIEEKNKTFVFTPYSITPEN